MGLIVTKQEEIDKYFESDAVSRSDLVSLLGGLDNFLAEKKKEEESTIYKEKRGIILGSAVDTILTGEEDAFSKKYYISQLDNKPSDVEMNIVRMVFDLVSEEENFNPETCPPLANHEWAIQEAIEYFNWQANWKLPTRIHKIIEKGSEYFMDLIKAFGKQVLSQEEFFIVNDVVNSLRTNPRTKEYFDRQSYARAENIDVYYQLPIYFTFRGLECKVLLDMVFVYKNPKTGLIESIKPVDLKTMSGNTIDFPSHLRRFRYDIQSSFYTFALTKRFQVFEKDIELRPFEFVVESVTNIGNPLVFKVSKNLSEIGRYGRKEMRSIDLNPKAVDNVFLSKEIKGFEQLLEDYLYYSNTGWKEEKVITENNGVLEIDWDGIK